MLNTRRVLTLSEIPKFVLSHWLASLPTHPDYCGLSIVALVSTVPILSPYHFAS